MSAIEPRQTPEGGRSLHSRKAPSTPKTEDSLNERSSGLAPRRRQTQRDSRRQCGHMKQGGKEQTRSRNEQRLCETLRSTGPTPWEASDQQACFRRQESSVAGEDQRLRRVIAVLGTPPETGRTPGRPGRSYRIEERDLLRETRPRSLVLRLLLPSPVCPKFRDSGQYSGEKKHRF